LLWHVGMVLGAAWRSRQAGGEKLQLTTIPHTPQCHKSRSPGSSQPCSGCGLCSRCQCQNSSTWSFTLALSVLGATLASTGSARVGSSLAVVDVLSFSASLSERKLSHQPTDLLAQMPRSRCQCQISLGSSLSRRLIILAQLRSVRRILGDAVLWQFGAVSRVASLSRAENLSDFAQSVCRVGHQIAVFSAARCLYAPTLFLSHDRLFIPGLTLQTHVEGAPFNLDSSGQVSAWSSSRDRLLILSLTLQTRVEGAPFNLDSSGFSKHGLFLSHDRLLIPGLTLQTHVEGAPFNLDSSNFGMVFVP